MARKTEDGMRKVCTDPVCERVALARGLCPKHYQREYRVANPERMRSHWRAYRASHLEERHALERRWYDANRERKRTAAATYRASHLEHTRSVQRARYSRDTDHVRKLKAASRRATAEQVRARNALRRARSSGATGSHSVAEWLEKVALFAGRCAYCGRDDRTLTRDHRIPLVRGGSPNIENIVPACGSCNSRKRDRTDFEFVR